jgi:prepilin-type N-terminal cleavage/methylation domain-containing protein
MTRPQQRQTAFTLVELLVVIGIIAVLIGLLLCAVQKAREAAARAQSSSNLRQVVLAIQLSQNQYGVMPPGFGFFPGGPQDPTLLGAATGYGNLFFHLLPFIEQNNLYQSTVEPGNGSPAYPGAFYSAYGPLFPGIAISPLKLYQNPSDPGMSGSGTVMGSQTSVDGWGASGYAFNAQVFCMVDLQGGFKDWWAAPEIPLTFPDGSSNTLVLTEKFSVCGQPGGPYGGANAWDEAPNEWTTPVFAVSIFPSVGLPLGAAPSTGSATHFQARPSPVASDRCHYWLPQTARAGGILAALADGSVRNVADGISPATWWAACTPNGSDILGSDW